MLEKMQLFFGVFRGCYRRHAKYPVLGKDFNTLLRLRRGQTATQKTLPAAANIRRDSFNYNVLT
jgi:hypothetical protein